MQLAELQANFISALKSNDASVNNHAIINYIAGNTELAQRRIKLYRGSMLGNIIKGLKAVFPVTLKLVGEEFFTGMAEMYVKQHPPSTPDLNSYGDSFPAFIAAFSPARNLPYLADVAQLDYNWLQVFYGPDNTITDLAKLAEVITEKGDTIIFTLPEGAKLIASQYPIADIWEICQPEYTGDIAVNLKGNPHHVLIWQLRQSIRLEKLSEDEFLFVQEIQCGLPFAEVCEGLLSDQHISTPIDELLSNIYQRGLIKEKLNLC